MVSPLVLDAAEALQGRDQQAALAFRQRVPDPDLGRAVGRAHRPRCWRPRGSVADASMHAICPEPPRPSDPFRPVAMS